MKKIVIIICFIFCLVFTANLNIFAAIDFDDSIITADGGTYQVTERTNYETLDYGLKYTRDIAQSSSANIIEINGRTKTSIDPQVVNVLEVPTSQEVKVVNWTYSSNQKWTKATVNTLAKDFEANNPGWIVLAGINGDFFDIDGNGALQYQTTGAAVNSGDVVRAVSSGRQVGFTNDGSSDSLIGGKNLEFTEHHILSIYDDNENIIKTFNVNKFNEEPIDDEISVYFSYHMFDGDGKRVINNTTVPESNAFVVKNSERGYAVNSSKFFGKGKINSLVGGEQLFIGQFAIVTKNAEVVQYLKENVCVRVQQDIVGDYAACDNISGCGTPLVDNGEFATSSDGMSNYAHPRTVIGQKEDGTIVLATVDGRQLEKNMYGMTYEELSAMMMYYNCTEAYNLDGGGSTTMIIRNKQGGFDVMNSPSDGKERMDSNAILVVVPEMNLKVNEVTDSTIKFNYISKAKDIEITDVSVTIKGNNYNQTKQINETNYEWIDLIPSTEYELVYNYKIKYDGIVREKKSYPIYFSTGRDRAKLIDYYYEDLGEDYLLTFIIDDPNNTLVNAQLRYDKQSKMISKDSTAIYISKSQVEKAEFKIYLLLNVESSLNANITEIYDIPLLVSEPPVVNPPVDEPKPGKGCGSGCVNIMISSLTIVTLFSFVLRKKK